MCETMRVTAKNKGAIVYMTKKYKNSQSVLEKVAFL